MEEKCPESPGRHGAHVPSKSIWVLIALILVSINLRPAITTVAGSLGQLEKGSGMDAQLIPLLAALPALAFGVSAPFGPWLARHLGAGRAVAVAMLMLAAALAARVLAPVLMLPGTLLAGVAIMAASVLLPQIIKANEGTGWWTGLCSMGFGLGAALGAGLIQPLHRLLGGSLAWALAVWAIPALLAALLVLRHGGARTAPVDSTVSSPGSSPYPADAITAGADARSYAYRGLRQQGTAWAVMAFFGLQAMLYFAVTSWLAVFLVSKGMTSGDAAGLLAWFSVAGLPASLMAPVLASRPAVLKVMAPGVGLLVAAALFCVLTVRVELQFVMVGVLGVVQSAAFGLGIALVVVRSAGPQTAGRLSAMSQGLGFALASLGPLGAALLHDLTGSWDATFWGLAGVSVLLALAGYFAVTGKIVSVGDNGVPASETQAADVGR